MAFLESKQHASLHQSLTVALLAVSSAIAAAAQSTPISIATSSIQVRKLGAMIRSSAVTFANIQHIRQLSDGRLLVNDAGRRQVLLLDSTLANPIIVIDSVGGRDNSYGTRAGGLLPYRGDSTIFADATSSTLLVIDPAGKIARVMSMLPSAVNYLTSPRAYGYASYSGVFGIVFRMSSRGVSYPSAMPKEGDPEVVIKTEDSVLVVAMNIATRRIDTLARITTGRGIIERISYNSFSVNTANDLFPAPDDWTVAADGSIALLSGREYRVRWINPDHTRSESPRIPFAWRHNNDDEKARLADSINDSREREYQDRVVAQKKQADAAEVLRASGALMPLNSPPQVAPQPTRRARVDALDIPDYMPALERSVGGFRGDGDNNLWIRPRQPSPVSRGTIYDVINRKGELSDCVQLPAGRSLIGFAPGGIVYLMARDAGETRIEAVRFRD